MDSSSPTFRAAAVAFAHDVDTVVLVFAEVSDGDGRTLEIQRAYEDDEYDVARGFAGHCVVLDAGPTAYDCVVEWTVESNEVSLRFTSAGARELGVEGVDVSIPGGSDRVAAALAELLDDGPSADDFTVS